MHIKWRARARANKLVKKEVLNESFLEPKFSTNESYFRVPLHLARFLQTGYNNVMMLDLDLPIFTKLILNIGSLSPLKVPTASLHVGCMHQSCIILAIDLQKIICY